MYQNKTFTDRSACPVNIAIGCKLNRSLKLLMVGNEII